MVLLHRVLTDRILGTFFRVYGVLGFGFAERVYERALANELRDSHLGVELQVKIPVVFRARQVATFRADLVVEGLILLEIKTRARLERSHSAQLLNYLRSTRLEVGLLLNFGLRPEFKRLIFSNHRKR